MKIKKPLLEEKVYSNKPPLYEIGDRSTYACPNCGSTNLVYDWELYCEICCDCDYEIVFDDEDE